MTKKKAKAWTGKRVRALRERLGLTQAEFGLLLGGRGRTTVIRWEGTGASAIASLSLWESDALATCEETCQWVNPAMLDEFPAFYRKEGHLLALSALLSARRTMAMIQDGTISRALASVETKVGSGEGK